MRSFDKATECAVVNILYNSVCRGEVATSNWSLLNSGIDNIHH
jgi:hypothetical protein